MAKKEEKDLKTEAEVKQPEPSEVVKEKKERSKKVKSVIGN